jgi:hypothetical protein
MLLETLEVSSLVSTRPDVTASRSLSVVDDVTVIHMEICVKYSPEYDAVLSLSSEDGMWGFINYCGVPGAEFEIYQKNEHLPLNSPLSSCIAELPV